MNIEFSKEEARRQLNNRLASSLAYNNIARSKIAQIWWSLEIPECVRVGADVMQSIYRAGDLVAVKATELGMEQDGWCHIERRVRTSVYGWRSTPKEEEKRITAYFIRGEGRFRMDTGGELVAQAMEENGMKDFNWWKLRWIDSRILNSMSVNPNKVILWSIGKIIRPQSLLVLM